MAKKHDKIVNQHTCVECANGKPDKKFDNLDIYGKPLLVICPFSRYKKLRTEKSCSHFNHKEI